MIRRIRLLGSPTERGRVHGRAFAAAIRRYAEERVRLAANGSWAGRPATIDDVLALAEEMLPAHRAYDADIYEEMLEMAHAARISAAEAVIVGGFTDFVDVVRAKATAATEEDGCTSVLTRDWYAQTWDMHDSATEHVALLDIPGQLVFTTVGCVGQIGMNAHGIVIGIDNLTAIDGKPGVTWPFVVRKALNQDNLADAIACVTEADLAGGHAFLLLDPHGGGALIEAMPSRKAVTPLRDRLVHTNHVVDPECKRLEAKKDAGLLASSVSRYERAHEIAPDTLDALKAFTRDAAICRRSEAPFHLETSGAVIARPATRELWAVAGSPLDHPYERFVVS